MGKKFIYIPVHMNIDIFRGENMETKARIQSLWSYWKNELLTTVLPFYRVSRGLSHLMSSGSFTTAK